MPSVTLPQAVWNWNAGHPSLRIVPIGKRLPTSTRLLYPPVPAAQASVVSLTRAAAVAKQNIDRLAGASASQVDQAATIAALRRELSNIQARLLALENP